MKKTIVTSEDKNKVQAGLKTSKSSPLFMTPHFMIWSWSPTTTSRRRTQVITVCYGFMGHAQIAATDNSFNERASRGPSLKSETIISYRQNPLVINSHTDSPCAIIKKRLSVILCQDNVSCIFSHSHWRVELTQSLYITYRNKSLGQRKFNNKETSKEMTSNWMKFYMSLIISSSEDVKVLL